jgi:L-threonylcarbamoyladenylate synthase
METKTLATGTSAELAIAVEEASRALRSGDVVALPTETVYGLAADALRPEAAVKIFSAKERPLFDPLIVHLPSRDWLERLTAIPDESRALVEALIAEYWPGPLTLVLPRREIVPDLVTSGLETVAVRMSAHPVFRAVIERFGRPLAAPSANRFGRISPTAAAHVQSELNARIHLIIDGGATEHGVESTIVKIDGTKLHILRAGPVTPEDLAAFGEVDRVNSGPRPDAPGQLASHYAPRTRLILGGTRSRASVTPGTCFAAEESDAQERVPPRVGLLAFRAAPPEERFDAIEVLSATGDLREAAATLFAKLRRLDEARFDLIVAEPVPEEGLGIAIMDRLRKAAAKHV